ncbi:phosphorylase [Methylobacterium isbiliense]|jgi:hopanoid-associated phosphorylase|uniref:5'-methylthioadenosine/S-adenosylhomocysteine nucleosidase n=1 Tax=Methylobacterium isbiliense TaxID=315478 RepID=A0ABQ4S838_9HYPH|nr:phosphorylase [Methylobacterium isbiliense]MDN3626931.1 phosphorylase [Methylobacterium isbiliense]GJD99350.1 5'-methylthioadenosine/S-adenosylhomocysteine nucleosidase [Methylobacterium isbiliense]
MIVVEDTAGPSGPHPVLAVTGLAREARLAAGPGVATVGAGGNPARLREVLGARTPPGCRAVMSIGIAGGLDPALVPGDVVVASGVVTAGGRRGAHPDVVAALAHRLADGPFRVVRADLAGVDAAVLSPHAKAALHAATGAAAVDMESHVAAAFADGHGLPFCAVRVVCDPADRALPAAIAKALKPNGEPDLLAVLSALARRSAKVGGLVRLARDSSAAFASLGRCRALLGFGLGVPDLGELLRDVA